MQCKNKEGNFCTHYRKADPPESVCRSCSFRETEISIVDTCSKYKYDSELCYDGVTWRPQGGTACLDRCLWGKGDRQ